jgi:hypothetical protein
MTMMHHILLTVLALSPLGSAMTVESRLPRHQRFLEDATLIELGNARPEGIHLLMAEEATEMGLGGDGPVALVTEILYGGVKAVHLDSGLVTQVVPSANDFSRRGLGLNYAEGLIIVAGGGKAGGAPSPALHVFAGDTGELVMSCDVLEEDSLLNDIAIFNDRVFITDSVLNKLWFIAFADLTSSNCSFGHYELDEALFKSPGEGMYMANGTYEYKLPPPPHSCNGI